MAQKAIKIKKIRNSASTSPGTDQFTRLGALARPRTVYYQSLWGRLPEHASVYTPCGNMSLRTGVTEQSESEAGKSARAHPPLRLIWQYMSIISHVYTYTF
jgi:hypothetical protein